MRKVTKPESDKTLKLASLETQDALVNISQHLSYLG